MFKSITQILFISTMFFGCAENIENINNVSGNNTTNNGTTNNGATNNSSITNVQEGDITYSTVDASSEEDWIYLHLGTASAVHPANPDESTEWDLAFQRFKVKSNGGISGTGGVEITVLPSVDFDTLTQAPSSGYLVDEVDSDDEDQEPDFVLLAEAWYDYDAVKHTLQANNNVYVVHSVDDEYYKIQFQTYYDEVGTPGILTFRWGKIEAPSTLPPEGLVVETTADAWTYVDVIRGQVVSVSDPSATIWDIAFSDTKVRTNSGTTSSGIAAAKVSMETKWEDLLFSSTVGFRPDEILPLPGPPDSGSFSGNVALNTWYNYDAQTHNVSPKENLIFLVRSNAGEYAKLRIKDYDEGQYLIETDVVERQVDVFTHVIDAESETKFLSFRTGEILNPTDLTTDVNWDFAITRTQLQTNGGTSGPGKGAAAPTGETTLESVKLTPGNACYLPGEGHICNCEIDIVACSEREGIWTEKCDMCPSGFEEDVLIPIPGPPGSGEFSGNPILNTWYNYDTQTHVVSAGDSVYVIKTADEGFAKIKFTKYDDGTITFDWSYAGAGRRDF